MKDIFVSFRFVSFRFVSFSRETNLLLRDYHSLALASRALEIAHYPTHFSFSFPFPVRFAFHRTGSRLYAFHAGAAATVANAHPIANVTIITRYDFVIAPSANAMTDAHAMMVCPTRSLRRWPT